MTILPKGQEPLSELVGLRLKPSEVKALRREATSMGLDLVSYVRMLLATHPQRKHRKGYGNE